MTVSLPAYSDEALAGYSTAEMLQLLIRDEDRVPRNVIDECARRGEKMVELLGDLLKKGYYWAGDSAPGEWWLLLHAVMILGLIPGEPAGELLWNFMRRMDEADDEDLQDWLSGFWPALFRNKPGSVVPSLRELAQDRESGWYVRVEAVDSVIAWALASDDAESLDSALAWAAGLALDENEDLDVRLMIGSTLLGFARPELRNQLEILADLQPPMGRVFDRGTIDRIYAAGKRELGWERMGEPWAFYTPEAIEERRRDRTEAEARFKAEEDAATSSLPAYRDETLAGYSADELMQLLIRDEDRVRRNVIDECARRGDEMLDVLSGVLDDERYWSAEPAGGEWWLQVHAVMILGLMPGERAGSLLAGFARRLAEDDDDLLRSWVAGTWHALFRNKPPAVMPELRELAQDEELDGEFRADVAKAYVRVATGLGGAAVEDALRWIAGIAFDKSIDVVARHLMGDILVDFPRPEYRSGLEALAREDLDTFPLFYEEDIERSYAPPLHDNPAWEIDGDPWSFYTPNAIVERQDRWEGRDARSDYTDFVHPPGEQYVRAAPKVGRNDPCPCGSGKKYKKCCLK